MGNNLFSTYNLGFLLNYMTATNQDLGSLVKVYMLFKGYRLSLG